VQSILAAWERGDFSSAGWAHPDVEYVRADGPEPGSWRGLANVGQAMRDALSAWREVRFRVEEYRELDEDRVLVLVRMSGRGKRSGLNAADLRTRGAQTFCIQSGKVSRITSYWDRDRALADLGLPAEADSPTS
jgi:ketosteroid isomerase-like protein